MPLLCRVTAVTEYQIWRFKRVSKRDRVTHRSDLLKTQEEKRSRRAEGQREKKRGSRKEGKIRWRRGRGKRRRERRILQKLDDCEVRHPEPRYFQADGTFWSSPKSRLPSVFHPTARQSCSLGSKRFETDLSKLYGTTPISDLFSSSLPSIHLPSPSPISPFFLPSICSPPRYRTLVTINPTKTFSLLGPRR